MGLTAGEQPAPRSRGARDGGAVYVLISAVASLASALVAVTAAGAWKAISAQPATFLAFLALALLLHLLSVDVHGRGSAISVGGVGVLAMGFKFGVGTVMLATILIALLQWIRRRGRVHRTVFTAASWSIATGAAAAFYHAARGSDLPVPIGILPAVGAGAILWALNVGLLSLGMALSEDSWDLLRVWRERFSWLTVHYLAFGPLAFACTVAYDKVGVVGLVAFAVPPALVLVAVHQYLEKTRASVEDVQRANDQLQRANEELAARNADLHELFEFAGGLAAQAHDRASLIAYAEAALVRMTGSPVRLTTGLAEADAEALVAGGHPLGSIRVGDSERWERLRDAVVPQLATALESAELVERLRKTHLETIAALSRSMEAKDYYTGGHTERVAAVAVALARRLGFHGPDLDALEIGALLHDIGKIGIPERILHKPGPLDDDEWKVMKEHPVISEYILAEVDLPRIVAQIARSSHERMDGTGYPDGLAGEQIPLAARIVLVADAFDALTSDRPYRRGRRMREALEELRAHTGTQFCPRVIGALELLFREEPHVLAGSDPLRAVDVA